MAPEQTRPRPSRRASVTLVSLCLTTALGIAVGSYVAVCGRSHQFSTRLLQLDRARELAQVGLEEALWALNQNTWTSSGPDGSTSWGTSGANRTATLTYPADSQGATGQVSLTVSNYASTGPTWPSITVTATRTLASGEAVGKTLQATTEPAPLFGNAIASSESYVSFTSGGTIDSWNSDPDNDSSTAALTYSFTAGNATNYDAVIAGRTDGSYGVALNQATLRGYAATFGMPVSYSASGSPAGKIIGPSTAAGTNVDTARIGKSAFVPLSNVFSVNLPSISGSNYGGLINNALALVTALLSIPSGVDTYKTAGDLSVTGIPLIAPSITIDRPMKLIVNGDLSISGAGKITVTSTGSLELFVIGDVSIAGSGFVNQTNEPKKLAIYSTSSATTTAIDYNTAASFCGVIFSENKPIDIRQSATFYGALLSRSYVRFSGSATAPVFHYDAALRMTRFAGVSTPYLLRQVTEP